MGKVPARMPPELPYNLSFKFVLAHIDLCAPDFLRSLCSDIFVL
jgi:hypothetical protein